MPAKVPEADGNDTSNDLEPVATAGEGFTYAETDYMLDYLLANRADLMSGNGYKNKALGKIAVALKKKFPGRPQRTGDNCRSRLGYVKGLFDNYEFVRGKSGVGWDDVEKHATAEPVFIEAFLQEFGKKYARCFKTTCPSYDRCVNLFGGNKATGENVFHPKRKKPTATDPSSTPAPKSPRKRARKALLPLDNDLNDADLIDIDALPDSGSPTNKPSTATAASAKPYDDELLPLSPKRVRTSDVDADDRNQPLVKHERSKVSGGSGRRRASRNAEVHREIARGLKDLGAGMSAALVTKADTSHIDEVVDILVADSTILPDDPDGMLYAIIIDQLGSNEQRARAFIKTTNRVQRIALLKLVLKGCNMDFPTNWV